MVDNEGQTHTDTTKESRANGPVCVSVQGTELVWVPVRFVYLYLRGSGVNVVGPRELYKIRRSADRRVSAQCKPLTITSPHLAKNHPLPSLEGEMGEGGERGLLQL